MRFKFAKLLGVLLTAYTGTISALIPGNKTLVRRVALMDDTCNPHNHYAKAVAAIQDAKKIASWAASHETIQDSTAFKYYFSSEDADTVKNMFQVLERVFLRGFNFLVRCGNIQNREMCSDERFVAVAFTGVGGYIVLCDLFFSDIVDVRQELGDKRYTRNRNGWCHAGQNYTFFQVGGAVILHELTHLDIIGREAGLPARRGTHGTEDIYAAGTRQHTQMFRNMKPWQCERAHMLIPTPLRYPIADFL